MGLNYQSIGSSGGIKPIRAETVTFGASDLPLSPADLNKGGLAQFPAIIGGTVPVFNLDGFKPGELRVTGPVLADIFLGKVAKRNDPRIFDGAFKNGKALAAELDYMSLPDSLTAEIRSKVCTQFQIE